MAQVHIMMGGANILCSKPVTIKHTGFRLTGYCTSLYHYCTYCTSP